MTNVWPSEMRAYCWSQKGFSLIKIIRVKVRNSLLADRISDLRTIHLLRKRLILMQFICQTGVEYWVWQKPLDTFCESQWLHGLQCWVLYILALFVNSELHVFYVRKVYSKHLYVWIRGHGFPESPVKHLPASAAHALTQAGSGSSFAGPTITCSTAALSPCHLLNSLSTGNLCSSAFTTMPGTDYMPLPKRD